MEKKGKEKKNDNNCKGKLKYDDVYLKKLRWINYSYFSFHLTNIYINFFQPITQTQIPYPKPLLKYKKLKSL